MIKFGTGGWRAVIADEFTKENIRLLMAGLCRLMEKEGLGGAEVCVGYDRRFLSKESAHWAAEVLVGYGFHPFVINRSSPTPLMMFTVKKRGEPYGIAVTASHNPAIYNGIKVFTAGGRDADETVTARIEAEIAQVTPADVKSVDYDEALAGGLITEANPMNEYLDSILSAVDVEAIKSAALRIGFDPMYGVSWSSLSMLLTTCRCDLEIIHDRHDTLFGGKLPAPNMETLKPLAALVLDKHCDLGIATDGDADRLGVIDNEGQFIHPNKLLVLLYYYLVKYRGWHGPCVRNNSTSHLLDRVAAGLGEKCYEVPVGFKWVSAKMAETDAVIGGESSGRHGRSRPHLRQGRHLRRRAAGGDAGRHREVGVGAVRRDRRAVRRPPVGRGGLPHDPLPQSGAAGATVRPLRDAGLRQGRGSHQPRGRLQGVLHRWQLGHLPLLRHGAAAAHGRRGR